MLTLSRTRNRGKLEQMQFYSLRNNSVLIQPGNSPSKSSRERERERGSLATNLRVLRGHEVTYNVTNATNVTTPFAGRALRLADTPVISIVGYFQIQEQYSSVNCSISLATHRTAEQRVQSEDSRGRIPQ